MTPWKGSLRVVTVAVAALLAVAPWASSQAYAANNRSGLEAAPRARPLDLDDPAKRRIYHDLLRRAGVKEDSPLYQWSGSNRRTPVADESKASSSQVFTLLGFGSDDAGESVSSGALYASNADVYKITLTLLVTDSDGTVVTSGTTEVTDRPSAVLNAPKGANPQRMPLNALASASVLYKDGSHQVYYVSGDTASYPTKVDNRAPALNSAAPGNTDVQVCIDRATAVGAPAPACNFVLAAVDSPSALRLPVIGSTLFDGDIDVDGTGKPSNASATLVMLAPDGSSPCRFVELGEDFFSDPGTKVDRKTLSWSFDPLRFDNGCAIAAGAYSFSLVISVSVQGKPAWATVSSVVDGDTVTTREIPSVQVVAGCLAKGSKVTLATGATRVVEQLKVRDKLKSQGGNLTLAAIASGTREESVTLTLASGQSVQVSTSHAIPTQRGIVQAQDVRLGDELTISSGTSRVTRIVAQLLPTPLQVYDLVLTPAQVSQTQGSTYYAGGILVGDGAMKAALTKAKSEAKEQHP
ncbi:hypothetical protein OCJ37_10110 [Xanthomonas sp. AM6]|uniref:hypothetical protein n=1 Tax=Xanthomonas sp. AM6 TaxID=2982531 RepID=UPI0021D88933|nr:hypothetical protein [Xanthomonas sp. AM6]UYB54251.1 hypothetical protein OCJ37_10110 [Xanthomonas sp. AM6]